MVREVGNGRQGTEEKDECRTYRCLRCRPDERPGPCSTSVIKRNRKTKCECALFGVEWVQIRKPGEDGRGCGKGEEACKVYKINDER